MKGWLVAALAGLPLGAMVLPIARGIEEDGWRWEAVLVGLAVAGIWGVQKAAASMPAGPALALAAGTAAVTALLAGALVLREPLSAGQWLSAGLLAAGAAGLVVTSMR
jgi:multidrug transporter EmrE-like cation transporter